MWKCKSICYACGQKLWELGPLVFRTCMQARTLIHASRPPISRNALNNYFCITCDPAKAPRGRGPDLGPGNA